MTQSANTRSPLGQRRKSRPAAARHSRTSGEPISETPAELQELLLERLFEGGKLCREVESRLRQCPSPELETIIKLCRVLVLGLSAEAQTSPERFNFVAALMKPVLEWAHLEEKRKLRELAEQKYHDQAALQKAKGERKAGASLSPETLKKIEHELKLFTAQ